MATGKGNDDVLRVVKDRSFLSVCKQDVRNRGGWSAGCIGGR
jgi:hypothetical protein